MISWKLVVLALVVLVVGAVLLEHKFGRRTFKPLAPRFRSPVERPKLGMEATNEAAVAGLLQRNSALARKTGSAGQRASWLETAPTSVAPFPEDETYAARYGGTHKERT